MDILSKPFEVRVREAMNIRVTYPDRVPVIVMKATGTRSDIPTINKSKYLTPGNLSFGQFIYIIRRQLTLSPDKALFLFVREKLIPTSMYMSEVYSQYSSSDGFLYVQYSGESVFGANGA